MSKNPKMYVIDTNVLLHDPESVNAFQDNHIIIPMIVLEELDNIKDRKDKYLVNKEARMAIRNIDKYVEDATPEEIQNGVEMKHGGKISVFSKMLRDNKEISLSINAADNKFNNDNVIINDTLHLQKENPETIVCLVTKDINMRIKAKSAGVKYVEDYKKDQLITDINYLPSGIEIINGFFGNLNSVNLISSTDDVNDEMLIKKIEDNKKQDKQIMCLNKNEIQSIYPELDIYPQLYIVDDEEDCVIEVLKIIDNKVFVNTYSKNALKQICPKDFFPKDIKQNIAMKTLLDQECIFNILIGSAGTGKTYLAMLTALQMTIFGKERIYDKIILSRSIEDAEKSIGFLPGTEEEKMLPWLGGFNDNIEDLVKYDNTKDPHHREVQSAAMQQVIENANIQYKSLNYIRGRSFVNTLVVIDEIQGLTPFQMKTLITRMGKGSKLICMGNLNQIDSPYITALTSGLTHAAEKFKTFEKSSIIHLEKIERSELAEFAENNL